MTTTTSPAMRTSTATGAAEDLLTIDEAAAMIRTPVATLRYWRYVGSGPRSFRLGRRVFYQASDIDTWIQQQRGADRADGDH